MVFLMETRLSKDRAHELQRMLGFLNGHVVPSEGLSGGLALFWKKGIVVFAQTMSRSHIDIVISCDELEVKQWRFTGFYGEPRRERRKNSWYLLKFLRAQLDLPWLCAGDFNEILSAEEFYRENEREAWQRAGFQEAVAECGFFDLGFSELPFTWDNRQEDGHNVKVRLDRALGDHKFMRNLGGTLVKHITTTSSDHCALLIEVKRTERVKQWRWGKHHPFRYEDMWQRHDGYVDFVNQAWDPGDGEGDLQSIAYALKGLQLHGSLRWWDQDVFGSVRKKIKFLWMEIEKERSSTLYRGPTEREQTLMGELAEFLAREEEIEKERPGSIWLKSDDGNTGFFQARAKIEGEK